MNLSARKMRLFWDVEPQSVDVHVHADYVMDRVMTRGTLEAMRWLRATSPAHGAATDLSTLSGPA